MKIHFLIKQIRKEKNITLVELSKRTGISQSHLSDIENEKKQPSFTIMWKISKVLNVHLEDLYKEER